LFAREEESITRHARSSLEPEAAKPGSDKLTSFS
jgi:hypothetical protein